MAVLNSLFSIFPKMSKVKAYVDFFCGGCSVAFEVARRNPDCEIYISDLNPYVVNTLKIIKNNPDELIEELQHVEELDSEEYFAKMKKRQPINPEGVGDAVWFMYIINRSFNSLFRLNSHGKFNVSYNNRNNSRIVSPERIGGLYKLMTNFHIMPAGSFSRVARQVESIKTVKTELQIGPSEIFVYFDPPYVPVSQTSDFVDYNPDGFGLADQQKLSNVMLNLAQLGCLVAQSNSNADWVLNNYSDNFHIRYLEKYRLNAASAAARKKVLEVVITNYEPAQRLISSFL